MMIFRSIAIVHTENAEHNLLSIVTPIVNINFRRFDEGPFLETLNSASG